MTWIFSFRVIFTLLRTISLTIGFICVRLYIKILSLVSSYEYAISTMAPVMAPTIDTTDEVSPKELGYVRNPYRYAGYEYLEQIGIYDLNARYYNPEIARFLSADSYYNLGNRVIGLYEINVPTAASIMQANNLYVYCGNSPIILLDFSGLSPTKEEALAMADHIYGDYDMGPNGIESRIVAGWRLIDVFDGGVASSVKLGVYIPDEDDWTNPSEYALVFRGSTMSFDWETVSVWANNIAAYDSSLSVDMWAAIGAGIYFDATHSQEITFVGHSKGGGEAIAAATATNNNAITFNAANFNFSKYGLSETNKSGITNYYIEGEILSSLIGQSRFGTNKPVKTQFWNEYEFLWFDFKTPAPIENHSTDAFKSAWGLEW